MHFFCAGCLRFSATDSDAESSCDVRAGTASDAVVLRCMREHARCSGKAQPCGLDCLTLSFTGEVLPAVAAAVHSSLVSARAGILPLAQVRSVQFCCPGLLIVCCTRCFESSVLCYELSLNANWPVLRWHRAA